MGRKAKEYYEGRKKLRDNRGKSANEIELTEDELFYLDHHLGVLPKPTIAERLNLTINQLQYVIKKRREERLHAESNPISSKKSKAS